MAAGPPRRRSSAAEWNIETFMSRAGPQRRPPCGCRARRPRPRRRRRSVPGGQEPAEDGAEDGPRGAQRGAGGDRAVAGPGQRGVTGGGQSGRERLDCLGHGVVQPPVGIGDPVPATPSARLSMAMRRARKLMMGPCAAGPDPFAGPSCEVEHSDPQATKRAGAQGVQRAATSALVALRQ